MRRFHLIILTGLLFCSLALAQEHQTFTVPFDLRAGLILLKGELNARPPHCFSTLAQTIPSWTFTLPASTGSIWNPCAQRARPEPEGACAIREVKLSLEHRSWLNRRVCVMDLSDVSRRMGVRVDGCIGSDVLSEFSAVRITR